jgi:hypothetical protein
MAGCTFMTLSSPWKRRTEKVGDNASGRPNQGGDGRAARYLRDG